MTDIPRDQNGTSNDSVPPHQNGPDGSGAAKSSPSLTLQARSGSAEGTNRAENVPDRAALIAQMSDQERMFCLEYLKHFNASKAARDSGYAVKTARYAAQDILTKTHIAAFIHMEKEARALRLEIEADEITRHWYELGLADARELTEVQLVCCRFCWGEDFQYQRTPEEYRVDKEEYDGRLAAYQAWEASSKNADPTMAGEAWKGQNAKSAKLKHPGPFKEMGGVGYDQRFDPHPDCPECFGRGEAIMVLKDARDLSPAAVRLFAGVKSTKDGLQVLMADRAAALDSAAKAIGMFVELSEDLTNYTPEQRRQVILKLFRKGKEKMERQRTRTA